MALSNETKYRVIFALGLHGEVLTETSMHFNSIVRDRLNIDNEFVEAQISTLLDDIDLVKAQLKNSPKNSNLKRIGDIELDTDKSILLINKEHSRLIEELSRLLGLPYSKGSKNVCVVL
jgi:hypothetical protein